MKKLLTVILALAAFAGAAKAQNMAEANKSFEQGLYQQAVNQYAPLLNAKDTNVRYEAQLKTARALQYSGQYDAAKKAVFNMQPPKDNLWKARYYIVKAQIFENTPYYNLPDLQESETDPAKFTLKQLEKVKKDTYAALWDMRGTLADISLKPSWQYVKSRWDDGTTPPALQPTLFDFLVDSWKRNETAPYKTILEQAYNIGGKDRDAVREYWHVQRIMAEAKPEAKDNLPLAGLLAAVSGATGSDEAQELLAMKIKDPLFFRAQEVVGKAAAAAEAAKFYLYAERYETAVSLTDYCLKLPLNYITDNCKKIKDAITAPLLGIEDGGPFNVPNQRPAKIKVRAANVDTAYMYIYKLGPEFLENGGQWDALYAIWRTSELLEKKPARKITLALKYPAKYAPQSIDFEVPFISPGFYGVVISRHQQPREGDPAVSLNFTNIAGYATSFALTNNLNTQKYLGGAYNIYSLDAATGLDMPAVTVHENNKKRATNKAGLLRLHADAKKNYDKKSLLMQKDGNYAIINYISYNRYEDNIYQIVLNTDRAIYRPAQEIKVKANVVERKILDYAAYSGREKLTLTLHGANRQEIAKTTLPLDAMGGAEHTFTLPQDGMLGDYS
ncbi:MAG: hypothetical protein LBL61_07700, partial [Elusimicrobiota bacterium]|nr:hypothetical protein [Elusimicrobiota bacterium]